MAKRSEATVLRLVATTAAIGFFLLTRPPVARGLDAGAVCQAKKLRAGGLAVGAFFTCQSQAASAGTTVAAGCTVRIGDHAFVVDRVGAVA